MRLVHALVFALGVVALGVGACASNDDSGGMAGAPAGPLGLGEVCAGGLPCQSGLICGRGLFVDQCSVQCASNSGCQLIDPRGACLGTQTKECGISCGTAGVSCPEGTTCAAVPGGMACKVP